MLSPARNSVDGQAARGTTAPLIATAMPRCEVSTAFSSSSAASVAATSGSLSPLMRITAPVIGFSITAPSFRRPRRQETLETEWRDRRLNNIIEHKPRDRVRCHRRQQDAVAIMPGRVDQALQRPAAEDWRIIAAAGTMPDPGFLYRQFLDRRHCAPRRFQQRQHAAGRYCVVKGFFLDGAADNKPPVPARHEISSRRPEYVIEKRRGGVHAQRQHLALDRTHRRTPVGRQPADTARPRAGGQYDAVGFFDRAVFEQDAFDATALGDDIFHRLFFDDFGPRRLGGNAQRGSELAVIDLVVLRRKNRAGDFPGKAGFAPARVRCRKPLKRKRELPLK